MEISYDFIWTLINPIYYFYSMSTETTFDLRVGWGYIPGFGPLEKHLKTILMVIDNSLVLY